jgi:SsrA-binding protein
MTGIYSQNKIAFHDYEILDTYEAGIILLGFEVKAIRAGRMNLRGSYITILGNQIILTGASVSPYQPANTPSHYNPNRPRVLLLKSNEKRKLIGLIKPSDEKKKGKSQSNLTVVPLKVYNKKSHIKVEIGVARGLKKYDKREVLKKKQAKKDMNRAKQNF